MSTLLLIDFSADGKTLYMIDSRERDKAALFAIDMATREATLLAADDEADIVQVIMDAPEPSAPRRESGERRASGSRSMKAQDRISLIWPVMAPATLPSSADSLDGRLGQRLL